MICPVLSRTSRGSSRKWNKPPFITRHPLPIPPDYRLLSPIYFFTIFDFGLQPKASSLTPNASSFPSYRLRSAALALRRAGWLSIIYFFSRSRVTKNLLVLTLPFIQLRQQP